MSNAATLKTVRLDDLELVRAAQPDSAMDVRVNFPFSSAFPGTTGLELDGGHNAVYVEIDPGKELGTHTDSPEELVVCLDGENVEAWAGDAEGTIAAGDIVVFPPLVPHGFRNAGAETARLLGFFSDRTVVSEFEGSIEPLGVAVIRT